MLPQAVIVVASIAVTINTGKILLITIFVFIVFSSLIYTFSCFILVKLNEPFQAISFFPVPSLH